MMNVVQRALLLVTFCALAGCFPEHMEVRAGIDPRSEDEDVRSRSTYYFRVFDICPRKTEDSRFFEAGKDQEVDFTDKKDGPYTLTNKRVTDVQFDSLYRFRMTGKGSSLFSKIYFESGTLNRTEIDPFGTAVVYDKRMGRHRYVTQQETQDDVREEAKLKNIEKLQ